MRVQEHGRELASMSKNGATTVSYTYDADGLRTSKTVNGVVYTYYYVGSQLARMTYGDYVLDFFYDANGTPIAMRQGYASSSNYTVYYYITNLQGDVIRLVDVNGSTAAYYEYDPYGNAIQAAGSHCNINPLRYRGYVYDQETSLYYLQSRYYNPEWGRFLNADSIIAGIGENLLGYNMFAYCFNNPVVYLDKNGKYPLFPPMIDNGLNLPPTGGVPVVIDGVTYYYAIDIQNGQLYEYWFDADGNLIWGRHHSDHNKPWKHDNPHDHKGGKDKDGNNTLVDGPQPVDEKFHAPDQFSKKKETKQNVGYVVAGIAVSILIYQVAKWTLATFFAPATGGCSYVVAALAP